jgi:Spy/CpxP family protein refolding chaperone
MDRRQGMRGARQQMQDILMGPGSEEEKNLKANPVMEKYTSMHHQQQEARRKFEEDIRAMLTPVQQGRFIILMNDFQAELREALPPERRGN